MFMLSENPVIKDHILSECIYIKCLELANLWRQKVDEWQHRDEDGEHIGDDG